MNEKRKKTIKIIDDFFNRANEIEEIVKSSEFSWFYVDYTSGISKYPNSNPKVSSILKKIKYHNKNLKFYDYLHFAHSFYGFVENEDKTTLNSDDKYLTLINDIVSEANIKLDENYTQKNFIRSKINFQTHTNDSGYNHINPPHIDMNLNHHVMLYYVNESDGDTFFFDDDGKLLKRVTPKKGRLVYFNGDIYHAGSNPIKYRERIVININLDYEYKQS